jgi:hypothetical protein
VWGRAGKAQSPSSEHCNWCMVRPKSTCYSSVGVGASHPPQTPRQSRTPILSTYRLLGGPPHCNKRGSASVGRREGENGNSDHPPPKRGLPDRTACRGSPGGGHHLLEDRYSGSVISTSPGPVHPHQMPGQPTLVIQLLSLPQHSQNHFNQLQPFIKQQWLRSGQLMDFSEAMGDTPSLDTG